MMVRFATECDSCPRRSAEYTAFPTCRTCGHDVCPHCTAPGSEQSEDVSNYDGHGSDGERDTVICQACARELQTTLEDLTARLHVPNRRRALPDDYEPDNDALEDRR